MRTDVSQDSTVKSWISGPMSLSILTILADVWTCCQCTYLISIIPKVSCYGSTTITKSDETDWKSKKKLKWNQRIQSLACDSLSESHDGLVSRSETTILSRKAIREAHNVNIFPHFCHFLLQSNRSRRAQVKIKTWFLLTKDPVVCLRYNHIFVFFCSHVWCALMCIPSVVLKTIVASFPIPQVDPPPSRSSHSDSLCISDPQTTCVRCSSGPGIWFNRQDFKPNTWRFMPTFRNNFSSKLRS